MALFKFVYFLFFLSLMVKTKKKVFFCICIIEIFCIAIFWIVKTMLDLIIESLEISRKIFRTISGEIPKNFLQPLWRQPWLYFCSNLWNNHKKSEWIPYFPNIPNTVKLVFQFWSAWEIVARMLRSFSGRITGGIKKEVHDAIL